MIVGSSAYHCSHVVGRLLLIVVVVGCRCGVLLVHLLSVTCMFLVARCGLYVVGPGLLHMVLVHCWWSLAVVGWSLVVACCFYMLLVVAVLDVACCWLQVDCR